MATSTFCAKDNAAIPRKSAFEAGYEDLKPEQLQAYSQKGSCLPSPTAVEEIPICCRMAS